MHRRSRWTWPGAALIAGLAVPAAALAATAPKVRTQVRAETAKLATQHAAVDRLRHAVATQESGNRDAARKLRQRDARIADLQKQLRAVRQGRAAASGGR